jgi:cell cycle checkpoint protein
MMMSLPAPVPRKGQKMFKAELWERNRKMRDNAASVHTLVPALSRAYGKSTDNPPGLTTRRILVNELLAYPSLIAKSGQLDELPAHVLALAKELSTFKNLHSSLQVMDEDELEKAEDGDVGLPGAADGAEDEELLYLPEDDIMDFD